MITDVVRNIFRINLGVKKTERVLIFCDVPSPSEKLDQIEIERRARIRCLAFLVSEIGKSYAKEIIFHEFEATGSHGVEPPFRLWQIAFGDKTVAAFEQGGLMKSLLTKKTSDAEIKKAEGIVKKFQKNAVNGIIALSNYSTSHTRFRDLMTRIGHARYASMPLFEISMLGGPMNVDWRALARLTRNIANAVNKAERIIIETENGSYLAFSASGRKAEADTGILTKPGSFGNLPAGEAYLAPVEGTAEGQLVLDWAPTRKLTSSVVLTVKDGFVANVAGNELYVADLERKLSERKENANIAELGIGTNSMARRPDNILESEKISGTIHIALGDNSSFGGVVKTPFHQDFVFFKPTVTLIRRNKSSMILMRKGKFA